MKPLPSAKKDLQRCNPAQWLRLPTATEQRICDPASAKAHGTQLITQRSQVRILSPLLSETAPGGDSGGRFLACWERICEH
jgi:hypothetical protein